MGAAFFRYPAPVRLGVKMMKHHPAAVPAPHDIHPAIPCCRQASDDAARQPQGIVMLQHTEVGVHRGPHPFFHCRRRVGAVAHQPTAPFKCLVHKSQRAPRHIFPPRQYHAADEEHALRVVLHVGLPRVECQAVGREPCLYPVLHRHQVLFRRMNQHHVIHVSPIVGHAPLARHERVEVVEKEQCQQL